jgi:hypothetical protein
MSRDQLIAQRCGTPPLEKKIQDRMRVAQIDARVTKSAETCVNASIDGSVSGLKIRMLKTLSADAALAFKSCLKRQNVLDPIVRDTLTEYVRDAFNATSWDNLQQKTYTECYDAVMRCGDFPCKPATRPRAPSSKPQTVTPPVQLAPPTKAAAAGSPCDVPNVRALIDEGAGNARSNPDAALQMLAQAFDSSDGQCSEAAGQLGLLEQSLNRNPEAAYHHLHTALAGETDPWVKQHRTQLLNAAEEVRLRRTDAPGEKRGAAPHPPEGTKSKMVDVGLRPRAPSGALESKRPAAVASPDSEHRPYPRWAVWAGLGVLVVGGGALTIWAMRDRGPPSATYTVDGN